jgi:hypothetical protein
MIKTHSDQNLGGALQKDITSVLQVTRKQSLMWVQIRSIRRLRRPYSPDTRDDVHVLAKVVTLRERDCLPKVKPVRKRGHGSVYDTLQIMREAHAPWTSVSHSYGMVRSLLRAPT